MEHGTHARGNTISRRTLLGYGAAAGAVAGIGPAIPALADDEAGGSAGRLPRVLPAPSPIPGGIQIPDGPLLHVHAPGPEGVVLPFTEGALTGREVDPSVITDFDGFVALAYHVGSATGSAGRSYLLETDIRVMGGRYVAADGTTRRGVFALV
jgi:hypothetical protein